MKSLRLALAKPQGSPQISHSPWSHRPAGRWRPQAPTLSPRAVHTRTGRCLAFTSNVLLCPELVAGSEPTFPACQVDVGNSKVQGERPTTTHGAVYMPEFTSLSLEISVKIRSRSAQYKVGPMPAGDLDVL